VERLLFYGSYASASEGLSSDERDLEDTFGELIRLGWARPESTFRRVFTSLMIPNASEEQMQWLDDLQRMAASATTAHLARQQRFAADATAYLPQLRMPTLILHSLRDRMNSFEYARRLAAGIAGAELVPLDSDNHILLADEPAWPVFVGAVRRFVAAGALIPAPDRVEDVLSPRELDVLRLVAAGRDNEEIAGALQLSVRTVERHLQNVYGKLGLSGRSARIAAAARLLAPA
jgi:DNA-binding CsgD family transcriptional regulator